MASAERTYVDPSALLKLYIHEPESAAMSSWRIRARGALPVTPHGRLEVTNGVCLAGYRKAITAEALTDALLSFEEDQPKDDTRRSTFRGARHSGVPLK